MPMNGGFAPKAALGEFEIQLPLYPPKQTHLGNRVRSEKCQNRKSFMEAEVPLLWHQASVLDVVATR